MPRLPRIPSMLGSATTSLAVTTKRKPRNAPAARERIEFRSMLRNITGQHRRKPRQNKAGDLRTGPRNPQRRTCRFGDRGRSVPVRPGEVLWHEMATELSGCLQKFDWSSARRPNIIPHGHGESSPQNRPSQCARGSARRSRRCPHIPDRNHPEALGSLRAPPRPRRLPG